MNDSRRHCYPSCVPCVRCARVCCYKHVRRGHVRAINLKSFVVFFISTFREKKSRVQEKRRVVRRWRRDGIRILGLVSSNSWI